MESGAGIDQACKAHCGLNLQRRNDLWDAVHSNYIQNKLDKAKPVAA
jgi:hypothetical protein